MGSREIIKRSLVRTVNCQRGGSKADRDVVEGAAQRAYKATHERVYGVVPRSATEDGSRESEDAQFRDLEEARG